MKTVALFGAEGFVGSEILKALGNNYLISPVTRTTFESQLGKSFDYVINSAMPAARFKAATDPDWDKKETVEKTKRILNEVKFKKFIQVSSVSARCQLDTVYGKHKAEAEALIDSKHNLIVRLGPMYGPHLKKGVLIDMLDGKKVFAAAKSRYSFAPVEFVATWVAKHLDRNGIFEVGAKNSIGLGELAKKLGLQVTFEGSIDNQEMQNPEKDFPDANLVLDFMKTKMSSK